MKKIALLLTALVLAACGGSNQKADPREGLPPKPDFKIKYINIVEVEAALQLSNPQKSTEGELTTYRYPLKGEGNYIEIIAKFPENAEKIQGVCMEKDAQGQAIGWTKEGECYAIFSKLAAYTMNAHEPLLAYAVEHAGLMPVSTKRTYTALQNNRFVLEADAKGKFDFFRRR